MHDSSNDECSRNCKWNPAIYLLLGMLPERLENGKVIQGLHQVAPWMKDPDPHTDGKVTFGAAGASGVINLQNKGQYTCGLIVGASILPETCIRLTL
jgi:hypothetical protein